MTPVACLLFLTTTLTQRVMTNPWDPVAKPDGACLFAAGKNHRVPLFCLSSVQISLDEYNAACDRVMPWFLMSFIIAAFTVPYRQVQQLKTTMFISEGCYDRGEATILFFEIFQFGSLRPLSNTDLEKTQNRYRLTHPLASRSPRWRIRLSSSLVPVSVVSSNPPECIRV